MDIFDVPFQLKFVNKFTVHFDIDVKKNIKVKTQNEKVSF